MYKCMPSHCHMYRLLRTASDMPHEVVAHITKSLSLKKSGHPSQLAPLCGSGAFNFKFSSSITLPFANTAHFNTRSLSHISSLSRPKRTCFIKVGCTYITGTCVCNHCAKQLHVAHGSCCFRTPTSCHE